MKEITIQQFILNCWLAGVTLEELLEQKGLRPKTPEVPVFARQLYPRLDFALIRSLLK